MRRPIIHQKGEKDKMENNKIKLNTLGIAAATESTISGTNITVKSRIPYELVFDLISWCVNNIIDDRSFISAPMQQVITDFAILKAYTNLDLSFLEPLPDARDLYENYDLVMGADLVSQVRAFISPVQLAFFDSTLEKTLNSIIAYRNSAKGLIDILSENAGAQEAALRNATEFLEDPDKREEISKLLNFYNNDSANRHTTSEI